MLTTLSNAMPWLLGVVDAVLVVAWSLQGSALSPHDNSEADEVRSSNVKLQSRPVMVQRRQAGRPSSHYETRVLVIIAMGDCPQVP
jgi:hypothetical protein